MMERTLLSNLGDRIARGNIDLFERGALGLASELKRFPSFETPSPQRDALIDLVVLAQLRDLRDDGLEHGIDKINEALKPIVVRTTVEGLCRCIDGFDGTGFPAPYSKLDPPLTLAEPLQRLLIELQSDRVLRNFNAEIGRTELTPQSIESFVGEQLEARIADIADRVPRFNDPEAASFARQIKSLLTGRRD